MKFVLKTLTAVASFAAFFGVGVASTSLFYQPKIPNKLIEKRKLAN